jgi:hypothetical protein
MAEATKYTVLAPADGGAWKEVGTSTAQTREQALELLLGDDGSAGKYMVIPTRYWGEPLEAEPELKRSWKITAKAKRKAKAQAAQEPAQPELEQQEPEPARA